MPSQLGVNALATGLSIGVTDIVRGGGKVRHLDARAVAPPHPPRPRHLDIIIPRETTSSLTFSPLPTLRSLSQALKRAGKRATTTKKLGATTVLTCAAAAAVAACASPSPARASAAPPPTTTVKPPTLSRVWDFTATELAAAPTKRGKCRRRKGGGGGGGDETPDDGDVGGGGGRYDAGDGAGGDGGDDWRPGDGDGGDGGFKNGGGGGGGGGDWGGGSYGGSGAFDDFSVMFAWQALCGVAFGACAQHAVEIAVRVGVAAGARDGEDLAEGDAFDARGAATAAAADLDLDLEVAPAWPKVCLAAMTTAHVARCQPVLSISAC